MSKLFEFFKRDDFIMVGAFISFDEHSDYRDHLPRFIKHANRLLNERGHHIRYNKESKFAYTEMPDSIEEALLICPRPIEKEKPIGKLTNFFINEDWDFVYGGGHHKVYCNNSIHLTTNEGITSQDTDPLDIRSIYRCNCRQFGRDRGPIEAAKPECDHELNIGWGKKCDYKTYDLRVSVVRGECPKCGAALQGGSDE